MLTDYYYVHGFNSGNKSASFDKLKPHFPEIRCLSYESHERFEVILDHLLSQVHVDADNDICFIGTSLGGFFAAQLARHIISHAVMFNPVIYPQISLEKFIGKNENFSTGKTYELTREAVESYENFEDPRSGILSRTIFLGLHDSLLDYKEAENYWEGQAAIYHVEEEHQIKDFTPYVNLIKNNIETVQELINDGYIHTFKNRDVLGH